MNLDAAREFYDGYLDRLKNKNIRHNHVLQSLDKYIPKEIRVLDIGCGAGITSRHLARDERDVVAVDLSPALIDYAKQMSSHFGRVKFVVGDITNMPLSGKFDAIVMVDVLEHILTGSIPRLFESIKRMSHEDTVIYLNVPSGDTITWLKENRPELLQIVDNPIETSTLLNYFKHIGFIPAYFNFYWQQYVEYLFVTKEQYNRTLKGAF